MGQRAGASRQRRLRIDSRHDPGCPFVSPNPKNRRIDIKDLIVITGASSGFGALAARAFAIAGHTVYASIRETTGRNAPQVEAAKQFATENGVDLRTIELDVASQESADKAISRPGVRSNARMGRLCCPNSLLALTMHLDLMVSHLLADETREGSMPLTSPAL